MLSDVSAQAGLEGLDHLGAGDEVGDRWQVGHRVQPQTFQELPGGPPQHRLARPGVAAHLVHVAPVCSVRSTASGSTPRIDAIWAREIGCL